MIEFDEVHTVEDVESETVFTSDEFELVSDFLNHALSVLRVDEDTEVLIEDFIEALDTSEVIRAEDE